MHAHAIFSAGLYHHEQYSASQRRQDVGPYLLFSISNCPEVLQLGFHLGLTVSHSPCQLSLLCMLPCCLGGQLKLTALRVLQIAGARGQQTAFQFTAHPEAQPDIDTYPGTLTHCIMIFAFSGRFTSS